MTDKRKQDESRTGHHADAHGSTPLNDAAVEQISGGVVGPTKCTGNSACAAPYGHLDYCPNKGIV
jgi:hypothetical protein